MIAMSKKITCILIANRGEIALRVIRACRDLGIKSIAIYSDEDVRAVHVKRADEAYHIGSAAPAQSYLNMTKMVETAKTAGADAIHPGYGFLSENENFSEMCEKNGIIFIGPTSKAMELTGDKMKCKAVMKKAKVPTVPGSDGIVEDVEEAADIAGEAGYPVLLKSAFGGGGRGIRLASDEKQLRQEFEMASAESRAAFGKAALFVEKYLERIRHIEFQLIRDSHGNSRHLFERECSIQRRHQKLLEEGPSVAVTEKMRRKLGSTVVDAARAVQYTNAGTFEFLLDDKGNFYFLEVNTRVQVEHPVTEFITGVDIVKEQIRIAAGERLSFKQGDVTFNGHSIECRVNAEDPETFAPSPGTVHAFSVPGGPGVRIDTFLHSECTVSPYYDSMIAKIIVHGRDRQEAIARMRRTLEMSVIEGIKTSIPLHLKILADPDFVAGRLGTGFMDRFLLEKKAPGAGLAEAV